MNKVFLKVKGQTRTEGEAIIAEIPPLGPGSFGHGKDANQWLGLR